MSELKLKPCPFCGGSNIDIQTDDCGLSWYVFCNDCGAMCGYSMTKDDVISAWDKRVKEKKMSDDSISRQAAIDAINHICPVDIEYDCVLLDKVDVKYVLSELPSAQPEIIKCEDCRYANECHKSVQYTRNESNMVTIGYSPIKWCSRGEKREE